jgi:O-antigen/teichoic acid export membrane protein
MTGALATMSIAQMGAGPGLTKGIANARALGEREEETSLINAAFRLTLVSALVCAAIILAILHVVPPGIIFGPAFEAQRSLIVSVANVCVIVLVAQVISGVVDSALAGYQEQMFSNLGSLSSNILSIGLLIVVCKHHPTISSVILVLYGVPTLSRVVNVIILFRRRPYLMQGTWRSARGSYAVLLNVGLAFWVIQLGGILEQYGGTYVLAHLSSTKDTVLFAIVYKAVTLLGAVTSIVTQPLWPAFTDAVVHRDFSWIQRSYSQIRRALTLFSCVICALMVALGPWIVSYFVHVNTTGSLLLFCVMGVYFVATVWTHLYYVTMMGMQRIWRVALVLISEDLIILVLGIALVPVLGAVGMGLAYLFASVMLPAWLLPRLMRNMMQEISRSPSADPAPK